MSYGTLSLSGFINEMKEASTGSHTRKFCFVLGAGASITSGIKSGQELVDIWDKELMVRNRDECLRWKAEMGITDENKYSFYSQYYDKLYEKEPGDGYNFLEKQVEHAEPSVGYVMLAHLLTKTQHNVVITTNFDHLIEDAVNYYSQEIPLVIGHEQIAHYIQRKTTRPTIIKIHRDLLLDPKSQTKEFEELGRNWKENLPAIFSEYHPVFIGYAGNDKSLINFLNDNSIKFKKGAWKYPYWMMYKKDSLKGAVLKFLDEAEGYVINHDGFDETLYRIGAKFDYAVPEKEDFLANQEKRHQTLSNAFAKFSEKYFKETETSGDDGFSEADTVSDISQAITQVMDQSELLRLYRTASKLHNDGKHYRALQIKQKLIEMSSDNALYWNSISTTLYKMGRFGEALATAQKAVDLEPDNASYWDSLGIALHEMGRSDEALAAKQQAVNLEPDNAYCWYSLSDTLHEMSHFNEVLTAMQTAVNLEPNDAFYRYILGCILYRERRFDEVFAAWQKAVDLEPDNAFYWYSLGTILYRKSSFDEVFAAWQKAVDLEPDNAFYWYSLGCILGRNEHYYEALAALQKAVDLKPDNDNPYWFAPEYTLSKMKHFDKALSEQRKARNIERYLGSYSFNTEFEFMRRFNFGKASAAEQKARNLSKKIPDFSTI